MYVDGPWRMTWTGYGCRTGEFSAARRAERNPWKQS